MCKIDLIRNPSCMGSLIIQIEKKMRTAGLLLLLLLLGIKYTYIQGHQSSLKSVGAEQALRHFKTQRPQEKESIVYSRLRDQKIYGCKCTHQFGAHTIYMMMYTPACANILSASLLFCDYLQQKWEKNIQHSVYYRIPSSLFGTQKVHRPMDNKFSDLKFQIECTQYTSNIFLR